MAKDHVGYKAWFDNLELCIDHMFNNLEPRFQVIEIMLDRVDHILSTIECQGSFQPPDRDRKKSNPNSSNRSDHCTCDPISTQSDFMTRYPSLEVFAILQHANNRDNDNIQREPEKSNWYNVFYIRDPVGSEPKDMKNEFRTGYRSFSLVDNRGNDIQRESERSQRHNVFRTRLTIIDEFSCDVVISSGSAKNLVSRSLVESMNLKTEKQTKVGALETCKVPLSIGESYKDKVMCDVVDDDGMDACDVVLGRPWLFDVDATYRGRDNTYTFGWKGNEILMRPLPMPKETNNDNKDACHNQGRCSLM